MTLHELETQWSIDDAEDAHEVMNLYANAESRELEQMKRRKR